MEENIYDVLGLTPEDGAAKVKEELEAQIKRWTNRLTRPSMTDRAQARLEVLKRLKADLEANPNLPEKGVREYGPHLDKQGKADSNPRTIANSVKVFGIDFGTTYSGIAYVDEFGQPVMVTGRDSSPTPSVVFFEPDHEACVGDAAKEALIANPEWVCSDIKRQVGNRDYVFRANGRDYGPQAITSFILSKLVKDATERLGEAVKDVVITYPAYFGPDEKESMINAAKIAGLQVVGSISEPLAAACSYGMLNDNHPQTVLIYDLGGGTFDATIVRRGDTGVETIASCGNRFLGGKDWDEVIQRYAVDQYIRQSGVREDDISGDALLAGDLELKSERAKKWLSLHGQASLCIHGERIEISVEQFEDMTAGLLQSTIDLTNQAIDDALAKGVTRLDKILLVGSSTFMPQVKRRLEQEFADIPVEFCDPNGAIAKGAAIYGVRMSPSKGEGDSAVTPVPVLSKGIALGLLQDENSCILRNVFEKGTPLPCAKVVHTKTIRENQSVICLGIYEHDFAAISIELITEATLVASKSVLLRKPLPVDSPIDILVQVDSDGSLANLYIIDVLNDEVIIVDLKTRDCSSISN